MNPDSGTTEKTIIDAGHIALSGRQIAEKMIGKTLYGDYGLFFKFAVTIDSLGRMEGINNAGAHQFGQCTIDENTISVNWNGGWDNTTNRAYFIDNQLKLFEIQTGQWQTSFTKIVDGCKLPRIETL